MRRRAGLGKRAGNFSHMNTPARIPGLSMTKHFQLCMACKVADKSERVFWTFFISVTGIKFPIWTEDKIRPAYRAHNEEALSGKLAEKSTFALIWQTNLLLYNKHNSLSVLWPWDRNSKN